jgi:hypothetical protein
MKTLPAVFFFLISYFSSLSSFAQDTSNYIPPVPKKSVKHKHIIKDSTAGIISDTTSNRDFKLQDTSVVSPIPSKKSAKHKPVINDSTDMDLRSFHATYHILHVPKKPIKPKFSMPDSTASYQFLVDPVAASFSDSIKAVVRDSTYSADSLKAIATAFADSVYTDSVNRHWVGWKKYQIKPQDSYTLFSKRVLKGKSKAELQYNIADFYLYLNGELVRPPKTGNNFFAAGCLSFKYDDTLLLNSGLGFKVGVGVGIKIIQGRFTGSLHANTHNEEVYKFSKDDSVYLKSVVAEPVTQYLKLQNAPAYAANEIIIGEYRATYKKFYQKNENDEDEGRQYMVRIIFRCRVSGGIDSIKTLGGPGSK